MKDSAAPAESDLVMRRNDVVLVGRDRMYSFYGRINRILDDGHAEVICCGKHCQAVPMSDLVVDKNYKGYSVNGLWNRMPTLRKLKQMAARYNPEVWKRKRETRTASEAIVEKWKAAA
jgi:hypothetical protein